MYRRFKVRKEHVSGFKLDLTLLGAKILKFLNSDYNKYAKNWVLQHDK